jgi:hypothetical protein
MKPATEPVIRILKVGSCPSLSGKSTLTYHIGCTPKSNISIRVHANTGGGYFSKEWVLLSTIQHALEKGNKQITAMIIQPLFRGKSANTPAFLLAVLKQEGLVQLSKDKQRCHEYIGTDKFMTEIKKLINSAVDLKVESKSNQATPIKKAAAKKA